MGKRQILISPKDIPANKMFPDKSEDPAPLVGQEVNILMTDMKVWHGYIVAITGSDLTLKDTRMKNHVLKISDIKKLYAEQVADR